MRYFFIILSLFSLATSFAQEQFPTTTVDTTFFTKIDSMYREDQIYVGLTYNLLRNVPKALSQNGFSSGISVGFLRDMPFNKKRTFAVALGAGFSYANYQQNLTITTANQINQYEFISSSDLSKGKIEQLFIDVPIEFRWRNSTPSSYKFWRIYTGFKMQYLLYDKSRYEGEGFSYRVTNNKDFNKLQYGPYIAIGFNTWNFQAYYGVNSLFKNVSTTDGDSVAMKTLNLGLMFYIL